MTARLRHEMLDDGRVLVTFGPGASVHVPESEAKRFAWGLLADLDDVHAPADVSADDLTQMAALRKATKLAPQALRLLMLMMERRGQIIPRERAFEECAISADCGVNLPAVYICKIRAALKAAGVPGAIETLWGRGWAIKPEAAEKIDALVAAEA